MKRLLLLLALLPALAQAGPNCLPNTTMGGWVGAPLEGDLTLHGGWVGWQCVLTTPTSVSTQTIAYIGALPELSKVGARLATIAKASDPLKSLQTADSRFKILPLTDPSLAAIWADVPPKYAQAAAKSASSP